MYRCTFQKIMWQTTDLEEDNPWYGNLTAPAPVLDDTGSTAPAVRSSELKELIGVTTIGKDVYIRGQIVAHEDLIVEGQVEGTVEAQQQRVTVGPNGRIVAAIKARHLIVQGEVTGNVEGSERVEVRNAATLLGDVCTVKFVCEESVTINGSVAIRRPDPQAPPKKGPQSALVNGVHPSFRVYGKRRRHCG